MSSVAEVMIIPGAAAMAVVVGTAYVATEVGVAVAQQMRRQYQEALAESQARARERAARSAQAAAAQAQAALAAGNTITRSTVAATEASLDMVLYDGLKRLRARLMALGCSEDSSLPSRLKEMQSLIVSGGQCDADLMLRYHRFCADVDEFAAHNRDRQSNEAHQSLQAEIEHLEADLQTHLPRCADTRQAHDELARRLADLRSIALKQPKLVEQGIANLRQRLGREASLRLDALKAIREQQDRIRAISCEIEARLSVVDAETSPAEIHSQARQLRQKLAAVATGNQASSEAAHRQILRQVEALFGECSRALQKQPAEAFVVSQVADVLMTMGYNVTTTVETPARETTYLVPLRTDVGMEVTVDHDGRMSTELISYGVTGLDFSAEYEVEACTLLDGLIAALNTRGYVVRERYRKHMKAGDTLRTVARPKREVQEQSAATRYQTGGGD
jgi:hypothetical protein